MNESCYRVYRVELQGENGWYADGTIVLDPGESRDEARLRIEADEHFPCRLLPAYH